MTLQPYSHLMGSLLSTGRSNTFTINCSGFDQHGVGPAVFQTIFNQKDFHPVMNDSIPTQVNISFTLSAILDLQVSSITSLLFSIWDPEKCGAISKLTVTIENLWLPDIFIVESTDVDQTPEGLSTYVTNDGHIVYNKPMRQNCTLTFSSFLYTVENMVLGMEKEMWEIADMSRDIVRTQGEWEFLGIDKATPKMSVGSSLFYQIMFYVAIRRRPSLYVISLLVPSSFLISIDALSFYLPPESKNRAPLKITLLLGYNVFLLMTNKLLPASGTFLISVYFALCLSLMVVSLLETIFITYLLYMATTQPPPMPQWLYSLLLHCTSPWKSCPTALWKENTGPGLMPTHLPELKEPGQLVDMELGSREAGLNGGSGLTSTQLADLWVQFSRMMDTFLFCLYLIFLASSIITAIILWNT
uniref:5-hydroxytryptamine receptor 3C n=1 Tax=Suricata suricatta TaxID=37032 RepID=A0A673UJ20_SURSU